jgi:hypothetical protein
LSISSGGNLLYIPVERETLFRVSLEYAGQIFNAIKGANWSVDWAPEIPGNKGVDPFNTGLCLADTGENSGVPSPQHNPVVLLLDAFRVARIDVTCTQGSGGGDYGAFVLVGHRPLTIENKEPWLSKFRHWIGRFFT